MDGMKLLPYLLFGTALMEIMMTPVIMFKVPPQNKLVVGFAMLTGALATGGVGMAFWMGWIGG